MPQWIDPGGVGPVRGERLGQERLEAHARELAAACTLSRQKRGASPLLRRFGENGRFLARAKDRVLGHDRISGRRLDAEWLADNFHIIEEVLKEVRHDLPIGYDAELPKLSVQPFVGYPRVYAIALELAAHSDGELDEARIARFVQAFQEIAPLTIGELWAIPTMLRLVLIENLRRLAEEMLRGWDEQRRVELWVAGLPDGGGSPPPPPKPPELSDPFVAKLATKLLGTVPSQCDGDG